MKLVILNQPTFSSVARFTSGSGRPVLRLVASAVLAVSLVACTTAPVINSGASSSAGSAVAAAASATNGSGLFDGSTVRSVSISYDDAAYEAMIAEFQSTGTKNWITATVVIDGVTFPDVGIKLKGNSTLRGLSGDGGGRGLGGTLSADEPKVLPWRIRLDKYIDGQNYQGAADIVVRGGNTETSLNEAVALELIGLAGLATEQATPARFSVNGGSAELRFSIENPTDEWFDANFDGDGILYKAEAGGDYSYRGDDPAAYPEVFEIEASPGNADDDYAPLIAFLKWLNSADDATFAAELGNWMDIDSFATYLAMQDLVANGDDIDGPGNNSYLRYDSATRKFTVVAWDQHLSFGGQMRPGGTRNGNVLATKFRANAEFVALYAAAKTKLTADLYASGKAAEVLKTWKAVLTSQASDLVSASTVDSEAAMIAAYFKTP